MNKEVRTARRWETSFTKALIVLMIVLVSVLFVFQSYNVLLMYNHGIFNGIDNYYDTESCYRYANNFAIDLVIEYVSNDEVIITTNNSSQNFNYELYASDDNENYGELLTSSSKNTSIEKEYSIWVAVYVEGGEVYGLYSSDLSIYYSFDGDMEAEGEYLYFIVDVSVATLSTDNIATTERVTQSMLEQYEEFNELYLNSEKILISTSVLLIVGIVLFICLLSCSGHEYGIEGIALTAYDRIPLEIVLLVAGLYSAVIVVIFSTAFDYGLNNLIPYGVLFIMVEVEAVVLAITVAARIKARTLFTNTIIYRLVKLLGSIFVQLPTIARFASIVFVYGVISIFLIIETAEGSSFCFALYIIISVLLALYMFYWMIQAVRVKKLGAAIADGDKDYQIDAERLPKDLKEHVEDLKNIEKNIDIAVEEQLKAEKFRTELITNVSHDLKTPLTSIINYVDLLQNPHSEEEEKQYLEVLARQSERLKKLTEDLIEASKASSGKIDTNLKVIDVKEIIEQSLAEYEEKLTKEGLQIVTSYPEDKVLVYADGSLTWRIFSNLYSNVTKYALKNSRVYVDVTSDEQYAIISVKNISAEQLNIDADELMERFVRGDKSRHSEGSGLGLNIASSLAELQNGSLQLKVDGDLFKVEVRLPLYKENN